MSSFDPNLVPAALRERRQWVGWKYVEREGKRTKVPVNVRTGENASATDPATWASFDEALVAWASDDGLAGIGYVFAPDDPYTGVDLDGCIDETGKIAPSAQRIIDSLGSYTEISPSGRGVKIFVAAGKPAGAKCRSKAIEGLREIEIYDQGRFFAVTAQHLPGTPTTVEPRQVQLDELCGRLWPAKAPAAAKPPQAPSVKNTDDGAVITRIRRAANSAKFAALYDQGDASPYGDDESAADEALCCILAFYTRDPDQIERIFSASALGQRGKWREREDYRTRTISAALEFVQPPPPPSRHPSRTRKKHSEEEPVTEGSPVIDEFPCTDLGNAERFAAKFGNDLRYCQSLGAWLVWDGTRWVEDQVGAPMRMAGDTARGILGDAEDCENDARRAKLAVWAIDSEHRTRLEAMVALAKSRPGLAVTVGELDRDQWVFNTPSGTIDLRTGELRPHRRDDLITKLSPAAYDPQATCPRFDAFLNRIMAGDRSLIGFLQRFLGYCLSGGIELQVLPIFFGVGANGKSVLIDTVKWVMGDYACEAPPTLLVKTGRDEHPTEIADLLGRRLVVASETEDGATFKLQLVKRLTGDSSLKGRRMRQDYFEFSRTHKTVMVTNNRPRVREDSEAVWRRLQLVPFEVVIPKEERDPHLIEKLREEAPGILAWLVRGCLECQRTGLNAPQAVTAATARYRDVEDAIGRFIQERCVVDTADTPADRRSKTPWCDLHAAYAKWCEASGENALTARGLGEALDKRGITSDTQRWFGRPTKVRLGIRLHGEAEPQEGEPS